MNARRFARAAEVVFVLLAGFSFFGGTTFAAGTNGVTNTTTKTVSTSEAKGHVLTKLRSGNLLKVVADFKVGKAHWELIDAFSKKTVEKHDFDSPFIDRAKSVRVDVLESFDPKIDIVFVDMSPGYQVVLYGTATGLTNGPSIGPMSEMKTVIEQRFDFTRLAASKRITQVNYLKGGGVEAYGSYVWDGSKFTPAKQPTKQP